MKNPAWLKQTIIDAGRPTATFLIGPPGSGKSTFIRTINACSFKENILDFVVISSDDILEEWAAQTSLTYSEAFKQADFKNVEKQMYLRLENAVKQERHVIIDRTNISKKVRAKIINRLPSTYAKFAVVFVIDRTVLNERLERREKEIGKYIPSFVVDDMLGRFEMPTSDEFDEVFES